MNADFVLLGGRVATMDAAGTECTALAAHVLSSPTAADDVPGLSVSASTTDGSALVSLSNLSLDAGLDVQVDLRGRTASVRRARVLTGTDAASHNTPENPDAVAPAPLSTALEGGVLTVSLPPHSFATVELDLA